MYGGGTRIPTSVKFMCIYFYSLLFLNQSIQIHNSRFPILLAGDKRSKIGLSISIIMYVSKYTDFFQNVDITDIAWLIIKNKFEKYDFLELILTEILSLRDRK